MAWYDDWFISFIQSLGLHKPPLALLFLVIISVAITYFSAGVNKLLLNTTEISRINEITGNHAKEKREAIQEQDAKKWIRVKYRENQVQQIQQSLMMKRLIPQFVIIIPFFVIFGTLRHAMGLISYNATPDRGAIVAILPFKVPHGLFFIGNWFSVFSIDSALSVAGFGTMYFLSAFATSIFLTRFIGVNPRQMSSGAF